MGLSPGEQKSWDASVADYHESRNTVEQASQDPRVERVTRYLVMGEVIEDEDCDYQLICEQISGEYMLHPDEIIEALALAEDGIELGQA